MASITKKMIRGRPYYYARECKRVDGRPKIVWQKYLGRAEDIIAAVTERRELAGGPPPTEAILTEFGAVAALYDLSSRLGLVDHIDRHVPKQGSGPSVGTYLLVATINRCVDPRSKVAIGPWFKDTVLRRLIDIEPRQLTSQRFWDNMDRVSRDAIKAIERDVVAHAVEEFGLDLRQVLFDATNFFTFIDSFNERSQLAQRGKSKEGRADLRIVGLALLVTADFHVPLFHRTYPGNQADSRTFGSLTDELVARCREIAEGVESVTIAFDKGNNSKDNLAAVADSDYHFVGALVPSQHKDLLAIPMEAFRSLDANGLPGAKAYRTTKEVFGASRTVVVCFNEKYFLAQSRTLLREIAKRQKCLTELQDRLRRRAAGEIRGGRPPTVAGTRKKVQGWMKAQHMKGLFEVKVTERKDGLPELHHHFDTEAWEILQRTILGKSIYFTDNHDWTDAEIVRGYRGLHHVEDSFRCMKDPHHISLRPQHHWTDQKIEVHVFCCVLALMLCSLLRRELHRSGIDRSISALLDELGKIREVGVVYPPPKGRKNPLIKMTTSSMTRQQRAMYKALDLARYASP